MLFTLSDYISPQSEIWPSIRAWLTNSTRIDLIRRLIQWGSDCVTVQQIHQYYPERAQEIVASKSFLTSLIGRLINFVGEITNPGLFLHERQNFIPRWRRVSDAFRKINHGLKENKYEPTRNDPFYRTSNNPVSIFKESSVSTNYKNEGVMK